MSWTFRSNLDLVHFLEHVRDEVRARNETQAAEAIAYVLETAWTTGSEFLGEAKRALLSVEPAVRSLLSPEDHAALGAAVAAIDAAWRAANEGS